VSKPVAPPTSPRICVAEVKLGRIPAAEWDSHAIRSGASLRSAHSHLARLRWKFFLRGSARTFEIFLDRAGEKIPVGHYTIVSRRGVKTFYDGLNLYPEYRDHWVAAMSAAVAHAGPGVYEYGWQWNPEPPRDADLGSIPGVKLCSARPILIQGVDFSKWACWDSYYRDVSENVRRNAKKAEKLHGDLTLTVVTGLASLRKVPALVAMRRAMYQRKALPFNPLRSFVSYALSILACPSQAAIAVAAGGGRVLAIQNIVEFADSHYYLDGAASTEPDGGAWYLQLAMLRRAYERSPKGKFLMGYVDFELDDDLAEGLLRSRRSLRVSDWPTSLIRFEWAAPVVELSQAQAQLVHV
jgi:hypothetical protein